MTTTLVVLLSFLAINNHETVTYLSELQVTREVAPVDVDMKLKDVFGAYDCGFTDEEARWLVARILRISDQDVKVATIEDTVLFWTDGSWGVLNSDGTTVRMSSVSGSWEITDTVFPIVQITDTDGNSLTRMLRPPVCKCPKAGGTCTKEDCERMNNCTGTDGTRTSCGFESQVV